MSLFIVYSALTATLKILLDPFFLMKKKWHEYQVFLAYSKIFKVVCRKKKTANIRTTERYIHVKWERKAYEIK